MGIQNAKEDTAMEYYPAYSTDQLIECLPGHLKNNKGEMTRILTIEKHEELNKEAPYYICYVSCFKNKKAFEEYGTTLCNALAQMLLYLLSHGFKFQDGKVVRKDSNCDFNYVKGFNSCLS